MYNNQIPNVLINWIAFPEFGLSKGIVEVLQSFVDDCSIDGVLVGISLGLDEGSIEGVVDGSIDGVLVGI